MSRNRYISRIRRELREAPCEPILADFCTSRYVADIITCAPFDLYNLRVRDIQGVEIWHRPLAGHPRRSR